MKDLNSFFEAMWKDYCVLNPQAISVYDALTVHGEKVVNDHVAFRTFSHPEMKIEVLAQHFLKYGYREVQEYFFEEKKLRAKHYEHPDEKQPLVFISELETHKVSSAIQKVVDQVAKSFTPNSFLREEMMYSGRLWPASYRIYEELSRETEYGAWVYAHGYRPNHFTVSINHLKKLNKIEDLNRFLKDHGFLLNASGGEVKGSSLEHLEQSSTMANKIMTQFNEGSSLIPGCYYEFAKRYPIPGKGIFKGFIATSADKIFESTNRK